MLQLYHNVMHQAHTYSCGNSNTDHPLDENQLQAIISPGQGRGHSFSRRRRERGSANGYPFSFECLWNHLKRIPPGVTASRHDMGLPNSFRMTATNHWSLPPTNQPCPRQYGNGPIIYSTNRIAVHLKWFKAMICSRWDCVKLLPSALMKLDRYDHARESALLGKVEQFHFQKDGRWKASFLLPSA
jgi:hypothetical protein